MISPYKLWVQAKGDSAEYKRLLIKYGCLILKKGNKMHYRNGREANNGDKVVSLSGYANNPINAVGILFDAVPGNDHCNGNIASTIGGPVVAACLCDCLHLDDVLAILAEKGFDKRPEGK